MKKKVVYGVLSLTLAFVMSVSGVMSFVSYAVSAENSYELENIEQASEVGGDVADVLIEEVAEEDQLQIKTAILQSQSNNDTVNIIDEGYCGYDPTYAGIAENVRFTFNSEGTLELTGSGSMANYYQATFDTQPWISYRDSIKKIVINEGIKDIGTNAFQKLSNLEEIELPNSLKEIGFYSLAFCNSLKHISIPDSVDYINRYAFYSCKGLEEIVIPSQVTEIGQSTFDHCESLQNVYIPSSVTDIALYAFADCGFKEIYIPKSVKSIGMMAFCWDDNLTDVYFEGSEEEWKEISKGRNNDSLNAARIHYNSDRESMGNVYISYNNKMLLLKDWSLDNVIDIPLQIDAAIGALALCHAAGKSSQEVDNTLWDLGLIEERNSDAWRWPYSYDSNGVAHTFSIKKHNGKNFITTVVRGTYDFEDAVTVDLFVPYGFQRTAGDILRDLETFLADRGIDKNDKNNFFFFAGHSMGGAVVGDMAKIIETTWDTKASQINCYTFASPVNVWDPVDYALNNKAWDCIHNVVNFPADFVPLLPPQNGVRCFARWGKDYYFSSVNNQNYNDWYEDVNDEKFDPQGPLDNHITKAYMPLLLAESRSYIDEKTREVVIRCPIDIKILNKDGIVVATIENNVVTKNNDSNVNIIVLGDIKHIQFLSDDIYQLNLSATDNGSMTYEVYDIEVSDSDDAVDVTEMIFENVALSNGKQMKSLIEEPDNIANVRLIIVDKDGNPIKEILEDGTEKEIGAVSDAEVMLSDSEVTMAVGKEKTITATTTPESASVTWSSSDTSVAVVGGGVVKGIKAGTAEITASITVDGKVYIAGCKVTVILDDKKKDDEDKTDAGIELSVSEMSLTLGMEKAITVTTTPEGTAVTWSSSDTSIAVVDRGVVRGIKTGTAVITASITVGGTDYTASCKVSIVPAGSPIPVPSGKKGSGDHTHRFEWKTIEATEEDDGELRYQCADCGEIHTRVPLTAYYAFNVKTSEKIRNASQNATLKIDTAKWISFHKMVMEALAERSDVTLEISFLDGGYKGKRCTVTIPKGTDTMSLVDKNGYTGFLFLGSKFGIKTN